MNAARCTFAGSARPKSFTVRLEPFRVRSGSYRSDRRAPIMESVFHSTMTSSAAVLLVVQVSVAAKEHIVSGCVWDVAGTPIPAAIVHVDELELEKSSL